MQAGSDTVSLIRDYQRSRDISLLERIVDQNTGLVKSVAGKFRCPEPFEDLVQCGYIGLINAVNHFDADLGTQFSTYATHLIDGEIRHHLRDTQLLKTPRWVRALSSQIDGAIDSLSKELGRLPSVSEIAHHVNVSEDGVLEVIEARETLMVKSLDGMDDEGERRSLSPERIKSPEYRSFQLPIEDKMVLYDALDRLSEVEKRVVYFIFYKDLTETEVGQALKMGQRKVSRVLGRALGKLRETLSR